NIYPNPAQNMLYINAAIEEEASAQLYNSNGALVKTILLNSDLTKTDISELSSGLYFVKVLVEDELLVKKFLKE
ncbi:MAG: T9SS type A sorting domain-containing protein, partial [Bacteroidales bacterium]|nr:T9SS type A sorting domain-containing protein [Bacteroidales bacterium]